jgi:hypothetical protein
MQNPLSDAKSIKKSREPSENSLFELCGGKESTYWVNDTQNIVETTEKDQDM